MAATIAERQIENRALAVLLNLDNRMHAGRVFCLHKAFTRFGALSLEQNLQFAMQRQDSETGRILLQVDTTQPVDSIDGSVAKGGSISGPGAAVWKGKVFVNSRYGMYSHMAGNALLLYDFNNPTPEKH